MKKYLGKRCRHKLHGFEGVCTGVAIYLTGCNHILLSSEKLDDKGKPIDSEWFDEMYIEIVNENYVLTPFSLNNQKQKSPGGPQMNLPPKVN